MTDVPHFSLPFRFTTAQSASRSAAVNEQDSLDEIADCVLAVLLCPTGFRVELPTFGIDDLAFQRSPLELDPVRTAVEAWEARANALLTTHPDKLDELIQYVNVELRLRSAT
jgi:phage baseplate assembly protein W